MITVERSVLVNSKTVVNPDFYLPQELFLVLTPILSGLIKKDGLYQCELEYRIILGKDIENDIFSAMTFHYLVKGTYTTSNFLNDEIIHQMNHVVRDAIDYYCFMIDIDPELIIENNNYN